MNTNLIRSSVAFTLSELIVSIAILAILATLGFVSLQSTVSKSRDSNRIATLRTIVTSLTTKVADLGKYPLPDGQISTGSIQGIEIAYKGEFGDSIVRQIGYSSPSPKDPLTGTYLPYGVSMDRKYFQIAATLENIVGSSSTDSIRRVVINPLSVDEVNAAKPVSAKVVGTYRGYLKFSSGTTTYLANFPSLIWFGSGAIDFTPPATSSRFIRDGGANIPYGFNQETPTLPETPTQSIRALTNSPTATFTGTEITSINDPLTLNAIFTESALFDYGTNISTIEAILLGATTTVIPSGNLESVNGVCSGSPGVCISGAISGDNGLTSCGTTRAWTCNGISGGSNTSCSMTNTACMNNCILPWGGSINHGASTTAYQSAFVNYPSVCLAQSRTCTNGSLSGSYTHQSCSTTSTYSWITASWGSCSASCGSGTQNRSVTCQRQDGVTVSDAFCTDSKPTISQSCNTHACPVNGICNSSPGTCITGSAINDTYSSTCGTTRTWSCSGTNGGISASCSFSNPACSYTYSWSTSGWSTCSATAWDYCWNGTQNRSATCMRSDGTTVSDGYCSGGKPTTNQSCTDGSQCYSGYGFCTETYHPATGLPSSNPSAWWCDSWNFYGVASGGPACGTGYATNYVYSLKNSSLIRFVCVIN